MKTKRTPSALILMAMFGEDTPIGTYAAERKEQALSKSLSFSEALDIIVTYAEQVREEQKEYEDISPYGGEDITVQTVDEIAFEEQTFLEEKFPEVDDMGLEIAKALKRRGYSLSTDGPIKEGCEISG